MTPTDDMIEALVQAKKALDEADVPQHGRIIQVMPGSIWDRILSDPTIGEYIEGWDVYYPQYETNTVDNRIIYTDNEEGNVQMTERTIEVVEKEMREVRDRLLDRRFIYGPIWADVAVTFDVCYDSDCSGEESEVNFKRFREGLNKGVVIPCVKSLDSMDNEVTLSNKLMKKINEVSMAILREEAEELRKLRAEMHYLESVGPTSIRQLMDQYAETPHYLR